MKEDSKFLARVSGKEFLVSQMSTGFIKNQIDFITRTERRICYKEPLTKELEHRGIIVNKDSTNKNKSSKKPVTKKKNTKNHISFNYNFNKNNKNESI